MAISRGNVGFSDTGGEWYWPCTVPFGLSVDDTLYQKIPTSLREIGMTYYSTFFDRSLHMCIRYGGGGGTPPPYESYMTLPCSRSFKPEYRRFFLAFSTMTPTVSSRPARISSSLARVMAVYRMLRLRR